LNCHRTRLNWMKNEVGIDHVANRWMDQPDLLMHVM
jgi:hypothetical protein